MKTKRISFLTNVLEGPKKSFITLPGKKSRGDIIRSYLDTDFDQKFTSDYEFIEQIHNEKEQYNACNLVFGNLNTMVFYYTNLQSEQVEKLPHDTVISFSNNMYQKVTWERVEKGLAEFGKLQSLSAESLMDFMKSYRGKQQKEISKNSIFLEPEFNF